MSSVFFSYASEDRAFAAQLAQILKKYGHSTWMDEQQILWGESLIDRTQEALRAASAVVVLLSDASKQSQWVAFELGAATAQGKKIFPVVLSDDPAVVPFQLRHVLYLRAGPDEAQETGRRIHEALKGEA